MVKTRIKIKAPGSMLGYSPKSKVVTRRKKLSAVLNKFGYPLTMKKLNALYVFNKKSHPGIAKAVSSDKKWLSKTARSKGMRGKPVKSLRRKSGRKPRGRKSGKRRKSGRKSGRKSRRRKGRRKSGRRKGGKRRKSGRKSRGGRRRKKPMTPQQKVMHKKNLSKYKNRPSPNVSAQDFPGSVKKGNDGRMYRSTQNSNGVYTWKLKK